MNLFESPNANTEKKGKDENFFVKAFSGLQKAGEKNREVLSSLEEVLMESGFDLAETSEVSTIFQNSQLKCRSESLEKLIGILQKGKDWIIENPEDDANMCVMSENALGYTRAMLEGFSERSVGGKLKIVVTFDSIDPYSHKEKLSLKSVPREGSEKFRVLWDSRPETARVSLRGSGAVNFDDIKMISLRLPIGYFPGLASEDELDELRGAEIPCIVRHYIRKKRDEKNRTDSH